MGIRTTIFGYPRIGQGRELKTAVEAFWAGTLDADEMKRQAAGINDDRLRRMAAADLDLVPVNDFSLYDFVLDQTVMFGAIPPRFASLAGLERYFAMARGHGTAGACAMTKWFDTNYHYIVPELDGVFTLAENQPLASFLHARSLLGLAGKPVLIGPFTYVYMSVIAPSQKGAGDAVPVRAPESPRFAEVLQRLAPLYNRLLAELAAAGVETVQLDEPALVLDVAPEHHGALIAAYRQVMAGHDRPRVIVHTYYESLPRYEDIVAELPVHGIGLDFTVNGENLDALKRSGLPPGKILQAGVLSGRTPWRTDFGEVMDLVDRLVAITGEDRLILSNAAPLYHLPVSLEPERGHLDGAILDLLAFADERLDEMRLLKEIIVQGRGVPPSAARKLAATGDAAVRAAVAAIDGRAVGRAESFAERYPKQMARLGLPVLPTTTIGSFPQTAALRRERSAHTAGKTDAEEYRAQIRRRIADVVAMQERLDIDVLVHGEFERTDMVEYFGERLEGFAVTRAGWVQSYGTRCVRPPIIYGDVRRPGPLTVDETVYAQSLTRRPVKGMLTGPVTILNWSFHRSDLPKREIAYQIALALRDEVSDLERNGIAIIQIDEPAIREGLPLRRSKRQAYLDWAVTAFRLTNEQVRGDTQVQAHICYSDFDEIIEAIRAMDADVMLIEGSRSRGEIIGAFERHRYDHAVGIGVYDVHSPTVPGVEEIGAVVRRALRGIDRTLLWVNPDCGLKTRNDGEVVPSLGAMVAAVRSLRASEGS